jgi:hypothetical protein
MQLLGLQAAHLIELIDPVPTNYLHNPCNWELLSVFVTWTSPAGATAVRGTNTPDTRTLLVRHSPTGDGGNPAPPRPKKNGSTRLCAGIHAQGIAMAYML